MTSQPNEPTEAPAPAASSTQKDRDRLWSYALADGSGCWVWQLALSESGYGRIWVGDKALRPHRFAYEIVKGPIPEELELDHLCRLRACINPNHLEAVTHLENMRRGEAPPPPRYALRAYCKRGHAFTKANTYITPTRSARGCRACNRVAVARYAARKRANA